MSTTPTASDRWIEALLGGRLMYHHPLGSVKTAEQARVVDRMTARVLHLRGGDPVAQLNFPEPATVRELGGEYSTGASDGHIWNTATGECSPLCPAPGGHSRAIVYDDGGPSDLERRLRGLDAPAGAGESVEAYRG